MRFRLLLPLLLCAVNARASLDDSLKSINAVAREGAGNEAATAAWNDVVRTGSGAILPILNAMGKGGVVADNWLRLAAGTIADKLAGGVPLVELETYVRDVSHSASARQTAFDLVRKVDPAKADAIEPTLINDPSQELRRGAVQRLIDEAKARDQLASGGVAVLAYRKALDAARDEDQVKVIVSALEKLGEKVDTAKHFGFLMNWHVIGPFDNTKRAGFDEVFPPEKEIKLDASYKGKDGEVKWQPFETKQEYGKLDFNKPLGMLKETTAYAVTTFDSSEERDAELRLGCKNGWKVWLNGKLLFGRDEYHRGAQLDQYKMKCHLSKGPNTILVKCCQNEQKETWTVEWEFQLRVCDAAGTAIAQR